MPMYLGRVYNDYSGRYISRATECTASLTANLRLVIHSFRERCASVRITVNRQEQEWRKAEPVDTLSVTNTGLLYIIYELLR